MVTVMSDIYDGLELRDCFTLLNTTSIELTDTATVVEALLASCVWCLMLSPSCIIFTSANDDDGTESR